MKNFPHFSIAKFISLGLLVLVFLLAYRLFLDKKTLEPNNEKNLESEFYTFIRNVQDYWEEGDFKGELNGHSCTYIPEAYEKFPEYFWSCNPVYIKCLLEGKISKKFYSKYSSLIKKTDIEIHSDGSLILKALDSAFKFQNNCHDRFLPQKIYSTGTSQDDFFLWDNYGRKIFIDRFYVNKFFSRLWKDQNIIEIKKDDYLPELSFTKKEMKDFCNNRNKRLLETHVFDAAAFFPSQYKKEGFIFKSKFPWGKGRIELSDDVSWCEKIYTKECKKKFPGKYGIPASVSWMGIYNILGGEVEQFEQLFSFKGDLKLSSYLFPLESEWHENGRRGTFKRDGIEFIDWNKNRSFEKQKIKGVAFRCMSLRS